MAHGEVEILAEQRENIKVEIVVKVQSENMEQMEDADEGSFQSTPGTPKDSVQEENEKSAKEIDPGIVLLPAVSVIAPKL